MAKTVLLLGLRPDVVQGAKRELEAPGTTVITGSGPADVGPAFSQADVDHVFIGGGLDVDTRVAIVREVLQSSDRATIHMKDHFSGPEPLVPFLRGVLNALDNWP